MTVDEVDAKLKSLSLESTKNGRPLSETNGDHSYGLNLSRVQQVARELNNDPCLADELYASKNHDLKVLATYIDDPSSYTRDELEKRSEQLYPSPFAEKFCHQVMAKSPHAVHFIDKWSSCESGDFKCYAYYTLAEVAKHKNNLADDFYARHLEDIANKIHQEPDTVKEAMQAALISIGCRDEKLRNESFKVAERIGAIQFGDGKKVDAFVKLEKKLNSRKPVKQ